nr:hypothetical protein [Tanacetum cinerariifolium]
GVVKIDGGGKVYTCAAEGDSKMLQRIFLNKISYVFLQFLFKDISNAGSKIIFYNSGNLYLESSTGGVVKIDEGGKVYTCAAEGDS